MFGYHVKISIYIGFASLLFLVACREPQPPQPSTGTPVVTELPPASGTSDQTPMTGAYPEPDIIATPAPQDSIYPLPSEKEPYPPPDVVPTIGLTPSSSTPTPNASQTPTSTAQNNENTQQPYPGPEGDMPLDITPTGTPQGGNDQATTPTPTMTATPTATMGFVRTELVASDPNEFSLVSGELQLVMFFADWSPMSKSMAPVMNVLEEKYQDRITFVYLDIDDPANNLYKHLLGDRLPPVYIYLDPQGLVLNEWQGFVNPEDFEAVFASVVTSP